ncbi:MAG: M48 family metalloprotease [Bacteroidales bacterium]|nr:M48 family metalloprotease [Bacteroidales bacterium]
MRKLIIIGMSIPMLIFCSCSKDGNINLFSISDDVMIGHQMDSMIKATPDEFPVLERSNDASSSAYKVYTYMDDMMDHILSSDEIYHRSEFDWEVTVINKDVMNAFATPGGKIYFYTGLINYLDDGSQLAGVMAHEVAHSDKRHSTEQLTKAKGVELIWSVIFGKDKSELLDYTGQLATGLASLKFSRNHEHEADEYSIKYLADGNKYYAKGIAGFFQKLRDEGKTKDNFTFLSTHPDDDDRLSNMDEVYNGLSIKGSTDTGVEAYNELKGLLK